VPLEGCVRGCEWPKGYWIVSQSLHKSLKNKGNCCGRVARAYPEGSQREVRGKSEGIARDLRCCEDKNSLIVPTDGEFFRIIVPTGLFLGNFCG